MQQDSHCHPNICNQTLEREGGISEAEREATLLHEIFAVKNFPVRHFQRTMFRDFGEYF